MVGGYWAGSGRRTRRLRWRRVLGSWGGSQESRDATGSERDGGGGRSMQEERFRDDARQLLRVAYERQVAGGGRVAQVGPRSGGRGARPKPYQSPIGRAGGLHGGHGVGRGGPVCARHRERHRPPDYGPRDGGGARRFGIKAGGVTRGLRWAVRSPQEGAQGSQSEDRCPWRRRVLGG